MDPIPDLPPMNTDPPPHAAPAANPTPSLATNGAHPPYAEMITAAIAALKDKDGSSRQAIAKYIEKEYQNLPPTHSALLTHHLKRMKNQGQLMMVKHSYMLPTRSVHFQPPTPTIYHQDPDYSATDAFVPENSSSVLPKRRPGRPPKPRPDSGFHGPTQVPNVQSIDAAAEIQPYQPQFEHHFGEVHDFQHQTHLGAAGQDLQPHYGSGQEYHGTSVGGAEPIFVSLGLADDGVPPPPPPENASVGSKRGRGRPPKLTSVRGSAGGSGGGGAGGSDGGVVAGSAAAGGGGGGEVEAGRRGRRRKAGRPKLLSVVMGGGGVAKRSRGRPKRIGIGPVTVPLSGNVLRPKGRPRRAVGRPSGRPVQTMSVNGGVGDGGLVSRRRGRPPKGGGANKVRKLNAQPLDRPSKVGPGTAVLVTDPQQLVAYQELKYKYEHLQAKVKEVVSVVKPYVSSDYENAASEALQELEALTGPDTGAAPHVQAQNAATFVQD